MASKATQSLTTGMKILGGANIPTYTLEFLTPSGKHTKGSYVTIAVPYAKLGRSGSCTVRFGDQDSTVSREHAAIERQGSDVYIVNLSKTNPTLVNGRPVNEKYFLNNGDEIQLSMEGPRLRYNETQSGTAKMGFTNRMNLVMQQSIKPYKMAAFGLLTAILVIAGLAGYFIYDLNVQNLSLQDQLAQDRANYETKLEQSTERYLAEMTKLQEQNKGLADVVSGLEGELEDVRLAAEASGGVNSSEAYRTHKGAVYFMRVKEIQISLNGQTERYSGQKLYNNGLGWTCTGFLVNDGKFVTARHCIQAWRYLDNSQPSQSMAILNNIEVKGGKVTVIIEAVSTDGKMTLNSNDVILDDSQDELRQGKLRIASLNGTDWAYFRTSSRSNLSFDKPISGRLQAGQRLVVMGYSYGLGGSSSSSSVSPLLSESIVAQDGLTPWGTIQLTDRNFGQGNSGGPVFMKVGSEYKAIGIVSSGMGAEIGGVVPLRWIQ